MLHKLKQKFFNPTCLSCGSYFVEDHLFCVACFKYKIQPRIDQSAMSEPHPDCVHLIDWIPDESDLISEMVYRFKSDKCFYAWKFYAALAVQALKRKTNQVGQEIDYIVTVPGSKKSSVHSKVFADFVQKEIGKPVLDVLEKKKFPDRSVEQKTLKRWERTNAEIQIREQITYSLNDLNLAKKHVLVVDDILTTGSSFRKTVDALGPVKQSTLLTLFRRSQKSQSTLVS